MDIAQYAICMHKKLYLKDIAEVITGYTFRTALQTKEDSSLFVLQAKNISDDSSINAENLDRIDFEHYRSKATVKAGDVVISSKGSFRAGVLADDSRNIIASSSVYILRPKTDKVSPEFLVVFLNSLVGQKQISEKATGAVINTILRKDLENIPIPLPDLKTQEKIVQLYQANKKLQKSLAKKMKLISNINEVAISKLLK